MKILFYNRLADRIAINHYKQSLIGEVHMSMQNPQQNKKEIGLVLSAFVLLTLLGIGYKLFDLYHMREISTKTTQIYEHTLNVSTTVHSVQLAISKIHTTMKEIIASQTREELDGHIKEITELEQEVSKELPVILKNINDKNALKLVEETVLLFEICKPTRDRVIELVKENRREEAVAIAKSRGMDHVVALDAAVAQLFSYSQDQTHYFKAESDALLRQWTVIDLSLSLLMMLLFIYIAYSTINKLKQHYTQNRRLNSVLSVISNINKLIVREKDPQRLMTSSCHILTTNNVYGNAWIVFLNRDGTLNQVVSSDTSENFNAFRKRVDTGWTPLCIEKTVQSDKLYCSIENTAESCLDCPLRNRYDSKSAYNIQLVYNDRVYGYLTLSVDEHYYNNIDESTLLNDVADDISYALYNIETEKILTESEKRYRALFKSNRAVELIVDPQNGEIIDCNDKAVSYYGYAYKQMKTMHISDINILNPEDLALEMKQATEQQRDMFHFQHRLANGDVRDVEVYSGPIKIDDRELLYSIIFDVTDRLKLEHYKTEVEERYRFVVQAASDGIWDWDLLTNELYLSPSWKAMLGYHDDEMENAYGEWESRIHPDDKEKIFLDVQAALSGETKLYKNLHRLKHKDGRWVWIEARGQAIFDENGQPIRMVGSHTDITERQEHQREIAHLKELYDNVIDSVDNLIFVKDTDFTYIACNRAFEKFIGLPKEMIVGRNDYDLFEKEVADNFRDYDKQMLRENRSRSNFEWVKDSDGSDVYLLTVKSPLVDAEGKLLGVVGNSADFTGQQRLYEQLENAQKIAHLGSWEYDIVSDRLSVTDEIFKIYGFLDLTMPLTKETLFEQFHPEDLKKAELDFQNSLESRVLTVTGNRIIKKESGETRYVEHRWITVYDNEKAVKTIGTTQDVTEQKKTEQALDLSTKRFELAEKIGHVGSWEYNIATQVYQGSAEVKRIFGIAQDVSHLPQEGLDTVFVEKERVRQALVDLLEKRSTYNIEYEIRPFDGSEPRIVRSIAELEYDTHGEPLKVVGFIQDITAQVEAEKALKLSNDKFEKAFNTTPNIIIITNMETGEIYEVNTTFENTFGYERDKLIGKSTYDINLWADVNQRDAYVETLHHLGKVDGAIYSFNAKNGHIIIAQVFASIVTINNENYILAVADDITEDRALEIENRKFIQVLNQSINELHVFNIDDFHYTYVNKAGLSALGYTIEEMKALTPVDISEYVHSIEEIKIALHSFMDSKKSHLMVESQQRRKDGSTYPVQTRFQVLEIDNIQQVVATVTDLTEQYAANDALSESEERFKAMIQQSPSVIELFDLDGFQIEVNHAYELLWGFPATRTLNKFNIFESKEAERMGLLDYVKRAYAGEAVEVPMMRYDPTGVTEAHGLGQVRWLNTRVFPLKDKIGNVKNIVITHEDVTDQQNAMVKLEQKKQELETIFNEAPDPMTIHDEDGHILMINKAFEEKTGFRYSEVDTIAKMAKKLGLFDTEIVNHLVQSLGDSSTIAESPFELTAKSGEKMIWSLSSAPLSVTEEGKHLMISSAKDITELKKKDDLMIIQSRHAAMGEMIGMIAHQWRQPITGISMNANNMLLDIALGDLDIEKVEAYSKDVIEQTKHLSKTIDDFRNFFKPDRAVSKVNMREILEETFIIVKDSLHNNNIEFKTYYMSDTEVSAYARELMQVFVNIINNAKDALLAKATPNALIEIKVSEDDIYVTTEVCDNGSSIDEAIIDKVFDPYFTTKGEKSGTGLGLYMSKMIIEEHLHGIIEVSNTDKGACFKVKLPKYSKGTVIQ